MSQWKRELTVGRRYCPGARKKKYLFLSEGAARAALQYVNGIFTKEKEVYYCNACNVWHHTTIKNDEQTPHYSFYCSESVA